MHLAPYVGLVVAILVVALAGLAIFGPPEVSERAFRVLRMVTRFREDVPPAGRLNTPARRRAREPKPTEPPPLEETPPQQ